MHILRRDESFQTFWEVGARRLACQPRVARQEIRDFFSDRYLKDPDHLRQVLC